MITEGDFVMAMTTEGVIVGQVEHVMREGGAYGEPGNPYTVNSTPENPAIAIRMLKEEDGVYYYTPYSIGALMSDAKKIDRPEISMEMEESEESEEYEDKAIGIKDPEEWPEMKRDGGKFPSSIGQPEDASTGESVTKDPKIKPKKSVGGVGTAGVGVAKSDEELDDKELFSGFGKDFTRVDRRTEVFLPKDK